MTADDLPIPGNQMVSNRELEQKARRRIFGAMTGAMIGAMLKTEPNGPTADYLPGLGALPGTAFHPE